MHMSYYHLLSRLGTLCSRDSEFSQSTSCLPSAARQDCTITAPTNINQGLEVTETGPFRKIRYPLHAGCSLAAYFYRGKCPAWEHGLLGKDFPSHPTQLPAQIGQDIGRRKNFNDQIFLILCSDRSSKVLLPAFRTYSRPNTMIQLKSNGQLVHDEYIFELFATACLPSSTTRVHGKE